MSALARTTRKSTENRSERASRPSRVTDRLRRTLFSSFKAAKWYPEGCLGRLRTLWRGSWGALGRSWGALGRSWGALRTLWGRPSTAVGRSWEALGRSWALLDPLWAILVRFLIPKGSILVTLGVDFRPSEDELGRELETTCEWFASGLRLTFNKLANNS